MTEQNQRCDHLGLLTNNATKLVDFYTENLGFTIAKEDMLPQSVVRPIFGIAYDCKFIKISVQNMMIELFEPISARAEDRMENIIGINHWGYFVDDKEKFIKELKAKKVNVIEVKRNSHIVYFIIDPDGNRIEIRGRKNK
jgi:catechol 2,3-dioxygenase-like lactoylglutathione lyase family enzyme